MTYSIEELNEKENRQLLRSQKSLDKVLKLVAQHRASDVAIAFLNEKLSCLPLDLRFSNESRVLKRQMIDFRQLSLQSELYLTDAVEKMSEDELLVTLFDMFDIDVDGHLSIAEIASCLTKMDSCNVWGEALKAAELSVVAFDGDDSGCLDFDEFVDFLATLSDNMDCPKDELCRYLILRTVENESGENVLDEVLKFEKNKTHKVIVHHIHSLGPQACQCIHARLVLIFQLLDYKKTGEVALDEIQGALSPILHHMDKSFREGLFDDAVERTLGFDYFVHLLFAVVAASSVDIDIDEVCNTMTTDLCDLDNANRNRKLKGATWTIGDAIQQDPHADSSGADHTLPILSEKDLKECKIDQLFDLWDDDKSGTIDIMEFFLGWRKLQARNDGGDVDEQDAQETLQECINAIAKFKKDDGGDQKLDKHDLGTLLCLFADKTGTTLQSTVEYLLVQSTLNANSKDDQKFIEEQIMKAKNKDQNKNKNNKRWPWGRRNSDQNLDDSSTSRLNTEEEQPAKDKRRSNGFLGGFKRLSMGHGVNASDNDEPNNEDNKSTNGNSNNGSCNGDNNSNHGDYNSTSSSSTTADTIRDDEDEVPIESLRDSFTGPAITKSEDGSLVEQEIMYDSVDSLCPYSLKSLGVSEPL